MWLLTCYKPLWGADIWNAVCDPKIPSMPQSIRYRLVDSLKRTSLLGFTSFGGPAVHFDTYRRTFVDCSDPWIDDQTVSSLEKLDICFLFYLEYAV